jgi:hypothetical protein
VDLTIDFTDLLKSFLVAFGPVLTDFLDLESADESESEASDSLSSSTNESSSSATLF